MWISTIVLRKWKPWETLFIGFTGLVQIITAIKWFLNYWRYMFDWRFMHLSSVMMQQSPKTRWESREATGTYFFVFHWSKSEIITSDPDIFRWCTNRTGHYQRFKIYAVLDIPTYGHVHQHWLTFLTRPCSHRTQNVISIGLALGWWFMESAQPFSMVKPWTFLAFGTGVYEDQLIGQVLKG